MSKADRASKSIDHSERAAFQLRASFAELTYLLDTEEIREARSHLKTAVTIVKAHREASIATRMAAACAEAVIHRLDSISESGQVCESSYRMVEAQRSPLGAFPTARKAERLGRYLQSRRRAPRGVLGEARARA